MAKRTRHESSASRAREAGAPLVDWREPARNAQVLDWHERAHTFGLLPVDEGGAVEPAIAEPPDRLLADEEPEAFEEQPLEEAERSGEVPSTYFRYNLSMLDVVLNCGPKTRDLIAPQS